MKALRHAQIKAYFFGQGENALAPHSQAADFSDLHIFKISEGMPTISNSLQKESNSEYKQART